MDTPESSVAIPDEVRRKIREHEESLLWGWDNRLCHWMPRGDALPLACVIEKRLSSRASAERGMTRRERAEMYESAARGWRRIIARLATPVAKAA